MKALTSYGMAGMLLLSAAAAGTTACRSDSALETTAGGAPIVTASVSANPHNVLSAFIAFTAEHADSARVRYWTGDHPGDSTPFVRVPEGEDTIVALGLRPAADYRMLVEADGLGGRARSDTIQYTTAALPDALQRVGITTSGAGGAGLNLTSLSVAGAGVFALAFDSAGVIRWYRRFEGNERFGGELKQQANGNFTLYRGSSTGVERVPGHYVEFTAAGDSVRAITVSPPRYVDNHELLITAAPDGEDRMHFFTYDHRTTDLRPIGGSAEVSLAGHQLVRLRPDGSTEFEWNAWDRIELEEWIEPNQLEPHDSVGRDFDHPNSLALAPDGSYIVSFRRLGQIMKIDPSTGEILWRVGGLRSDVDFPDDPLGGFTAQHSATILPNGNLLLYDNGNQHGPPETRAVEYALDFSNRTARLVWQFRHVPPVYTQAVGSTQRLRNGNTLVGYGWIGRAVEAGADGSVHWEVDLTVDGAATRVYRLVRIASLYRSLAP